MSSVAEFVVRPMKLQDLEMVLPFSESLRLQYDAIKCDPMWKVDWLLDFMAKPSNLCLTACRPLPVGYLLAETCSEEYSKIKFLKVREIYVELGSRLLGCGTMLMNEARIQAGRLQCCYITVKVHDGIPSAGFFNGLGFLAFSTEYRAET